MTSIEAGILGASPRPSHLVQLPRRRKADGGAHRENHPRAVRSVGEWREHQYREQCRWRCSDHLPERRKCTFRDARATSSRGADSAIVHR